MDRGKVVIVCGIIGSGKSSLSKELAEALGEHTLWLREPDELGGNPYLSDYYENPKRWAFTMQLALLSHRFSQHEHAQWHSLCTGKHAILDASYWQDTAFARLQLKQGLMTQREFDTYSGIYRAMTASVLYPTACVHIQVTPEVANKRISRRMEKQTGRKCETAIDLDYLRGLETEIGHVLSVLKDKGVPVLEVPWNEDRGTREARHSTVVSLAEKILAIVPSDPFLDLHRRTV